MNLNHRIHQLNANYVNKELQSNEVTETLQGLDPDSVCFVNFGIGEEAVRFKTLNPDVIVHGYEYEVLAQRYGDNKYSLTDVIDNVKIGDFVLDDSSEIYDVTFTDYPLHWLSKSKRDEFLNKMCNMSKVAVVLSDDCGISYDEVYGEECKCGIMIDPLVYLTETENPKSQDTTSPLNTTEFVLPESDATERASVDAQEHSTENMTDESSSENGASE